MKIFLSAALGIVGLLSQTFAADPSPVFASLKGDLVASKGKRLAKFDETALANVKYYAVYFSASWCGPCRAFTPKLVQWYEQNKKSNPHFELVFFSNDRGEKEMAEYMAGDKMPWPALDFGKKDKNRVLAKLAGNGIPCLVLLDDQGTVLSHSYEGGKYVGPSKVLSDIDRVLAENKPSAEATAAATATGAGEKKAGSTDFNEFFKKKAGAQ